MSDSVAASVRNGSISQMEAFWRNWISTANLFSSVKTVSRTWRLVGDNRIGTSAGSQTDLKIRALVRKQLIYYLKEEINGDELLMKEIWEQCETAEHVDAAKRELAEVVTRLKDREATHGL